VIAGEGGVDLRPLIHDEGTVREDRLANLGSRQNEEVRRARGLKAHLSASVKGESMFGGQLLFATLGTDDDIFQLMEIRCFERKRVGCLFGFLKL
jgi:hypothetical protein